MNLLGAIAPFFSLQNLIQRSGHRLLLPFYHSVQGDQPLHHIRHLYRPRSKQKFEQDLDFILRHFQPISLASLVEHVQQSKPFEQNSFFLSFDDGLKEVYEIAAPILERKGVTATVFLNSAFVDNKDLFFRYKASLLIEQFRSKGLDSSQKLLLNTIGISESNFPQKILEIEYVHRNQLDKIAEILNVEFDNFLKSETPYLTSAQITNLAERGFTFGGHSIDHPFYKDISVDEQIRQSQESIQLARQLSESNISAFSIPFSDEGVSKTFFETGKKEKWLDISFGISGLKKDEVPYHLHRFPIEKSTWSAQKQIQTEYLYHFVKALFGKNRISRS